MHLTARIAFVLVYKISQILILLSIANKWKICKACLKSLQILVNWEGQRSWSEGFSLSLHLTIQRCNTADQGGILFFYSSFVLSCNKIIIRKPFNEESQEILTLKEIKKGNTSQSFRSARFPKLQIFIEIFCSNLQSPAWSRRCVYPLAHQHDGQKIV